MASNDTDDLAEEKAKSWPELLEQRKYLENWLYELEYLQQTGDIWVEDSKVNYVRMKLKLLNDRLDMDMGAKLSMDTLELGKWDRLSYAELRD